MKSFDELKQLVTDAEPEVVKAETGNKAARTRARVTLMAIKKKAQDVRVELMGKNKDDGDGE